MLYSTKRGEDLSVVLVWFDIIIIDIIAFIRRRDI